MRTASPNLRSVGGQSLLSVPVSASVCYSWIPETQIGASAQQDIIWDDILGILERKSVFPRKSKRYIIYISGTRPFRLLAEFRLFL